MNFYSRMILHPVESSGDTTENTDNKANNSLFCKGFHVNSLAPALIKLGLISDKSQNDVFYHDEYSNQNYYLAGNKFSILIMFMGCAPKVSLLPDKNNLIDSNFVAIKISPLYTKPCFYPGRVPFSSRCPKCKETIDVAVDISDNVMQRPLLCKSCHYERSYSSVNWRNKAGIGRLFIEIMGIFESEAIPSDSLLDALKGLTGCKWSYFYANESSLKFLPA